jgi:hypothetical protein
MLEYMDEHAKYHLDVKDALRQLTKEPDPVISLTVESVAKHWKELVELAAAT